MFAILRLCVQCQKINVANFGRLVYGVSRPYSLGRKPRSYQLGAYLKPLLFTTTVCTGSFAVSIISYQHGKSWVQHSNTLKKVYRWWDDFTKRVHQNKAFLGILAVNILVFCLWRIPPLHHFMMRYFQSSSSKKGSTVSMLLACFSHVEFWHIAINMLVLWSFMQTLEYSVGKDLTIPFFVSAGVFSSLVSRYNGLIRKDLTASRGASGAIMGVMTLVVTKWPDLNLILIFFPFVSIPALWGLGGIVMLDFIGLIRGWRTFDHAAHLGGVVFAILYDKVFSSGVSKLKKITRELLPPSR